MTGRRGDIGRQDVYAAEIAAFEGTSYEALINFEQLAGLASVIQAGDWWPAGPFTVRRARSDAGSSSTRAGGGARPVVRLTAPQMTLATLIHELAHVLAGPGSGHGPLFRRAHLDLTLHAFGEVEVGWLEQAYADVGLSIADRRWPAPPDSQSRPPLATSDPGWAL